MVFDNRGSRPMVSRAGDHDHIEQDPVRRLGGSDVQGDNQDRRIIGQRDIRGRRRPDHRRRACRSGPVRSDIRSDEASGYHIPAPHQVRTVGVPLRSSQVVRSLWREHIDLGRLAHAEHLQRRRVLVLGIPYEARGPHRRSHDEDQRIQRELRRPRRPSSQMVCGHPSFGRRASNARIRHGRRNRNGRIRRGAGRNRHRPTQLHGQQRQSDLQDGLHPRRLGDPRRKRREVRLRVGKPVYDIVQCHGQGQVDLRSERPGLLAGRGIPCQRGGVRRPRRIVDHT